MESKFSLNRRSFLKVGAFAGVVGAGALAGCSPSSTEDASEAVSTADEFVAAGTPTFLQKPDPITDFESEETFEVVIVGAGAAGITAAHKALDDGAQVGIIQKESAGNGNGFRASGIVAGATAAQKAAAVSTMLASSDYRAKRELLESYVDNSADAITRMRELLQEVGIEFGTGGAVDQNTVDGGDTTVFEVDCDGTTVEFFSAIPAVTWMNAVPTLCEYAEERGATVFYSTAGVQLVQDDDGRVTGVIGETETGHILVNATKAVIIATGDYQGNAEMIHYYCPDVDGFPPLTVGRTGQGHCMGVWAGGVIEPVGHTKMIHDVWMNNAPYMVVNPDGNRFMNEHMQWWKMNTLMRDIMQANADTPTGATIFSIMDSNYVAQAEAWSAIDSDIVAKEVPDEDDGVTFSGDTLEELAAEIGVDADALVASVERYNELVALGADEDFGKNPAFLATVETGPFYAVQRDFNYGLSAVLGGLIVDGSNRVLDADENPIEGLYAVGNASGPFFGSIDYPMDVKGLSVGRAVTTGYVAGREAAAL